MALVKKLYYKFRYKLVDRQIKSMREFNSNMSESEVRKSSGFQRTAKKRDFYFSKLQEIERK